MSNQPSSEELRTLSTISYEKNEITIYLGDREEILAGWDIAEPAIMKEFRDCLTDWFNGGGHIRMLAELEEKYPHLKE